MKAGTAVAHPTALALLMDRRARSRRLRTSAVARERRCGDRRRSSKRDTMQDVASALSEHFSEDVCLRIGRQRVHVLVKKGCVS